MSSLYFNTINWRKYPEKIPENVTELVIQYVHLTNIPENIREAKNLKVLIITNTPLQVLENLPPNLEYLSVAFNMIREVKELPKTLKTFKCNYNRLKSLDNLPVNLENLDCGDNEIETIKYLPDSLIHLECGANKLVSLPRLPKKLEELFVQYNYLESLPTLPEGLKVFEYDNNSKKLEIDYLPNSLKCLVDNKKKRYGMSYFQLILEETSNFVEKESLVNLRKKLEQLRNSSRTKLIKEELMMKAWHPDRVERWLAQGYETDILD